LLFSIKSKLTAAHRLLRTIGFDRVIHSESVLDEYYKVFFAQNQENHARLGIIASKKTLPSAADRNYVKRTIREAFRQHDIKAFKLDMVVMVRRACVRKGKPQTKALEVLFSRIQSKCAKQ
jgi:ribonuclease P protein component